MMMHVTVVFKRAPTAVCSHSFCVAELSVCVSRIHMDMDASAFKTLHVKDLSGFIREKGIPIDFCNALEGMVSTYHDLA